MHAASVDDGFSPVCLSACAPISRATAASMFSCPLIHSFIHSFIHPMFPTQASFSSIQPSPAQPSPAQLSPKPPPQQSHSLPSFHLISSHLVQSHPRSSNTLNTLNTLIANRIALPLVHASMHPFIHWRLPSGLDSSRVAHSHHARLHLVGSPLPADTDPF